MRHHSWFTRLSLLLMLGLCTSRCGPVEPQLRPATTTESTRSLAKISSRLVQVRQLAREGKSVEEIQRMYPLLRFRDDLVQIEVRLGSLTPELVDHMRDIGMRVESFFYPYARVYGLCDLELLDEIAALPEVATIHPHYAARTHS